MPNDYVVDLEALRVLCGGDITAEGIRKEYVKTGVIKPISGGGSGKGALKFNAAEAIGGIIGHLRRQNKERRSKTTGLEDIKRKAMNVKAELDIRKLAVIDKDLHHREDIKKVWGVMLSRLRTNLLGMPQIAAVEVSGEEDVKIVADILYKHIKNALRELSDFNWDAFAEGGGGYIDEVTNELIVDETGGNDGAGG